MFLKRAANFYINWLYLGTLLRNAIIVAFVGVVQAYNRAGGQPNWNMLFWLFVLLFAESLIEHTGNQKFLTLLLQIWQALQQLNLRQTNLQQIDNKPPSQFRQTKST